MIRLIMRENTVYVYGRDVKIDNYIDQITRFRATGYEMSDNYINGNWDGYTRLYNPKAGTFPIGLIGEVEMIFLLNDIEYKKIDERIFAKHEKLKLDYDPSMRDYQIAAAREALWAKRAIIQLPTGSGKTRVAMWLMGKLRLPTVFYVHTKELLYQTIANFKDSFKTENIGQVGDGKIIMEPLTVAMIQTSFMLPKELFNNYGITIIDECHHIGCETFFDIAINSKSEYLFGLSATPRRTDGKDMLLQAGAGPICYKISTSELINLGYLARPHIHSLSVSPITFKSSDNFNAVITKGIVTNEERNNKIIAKAIELSRLGKVYIHVKRIDHGKILANMINNNFGTLDPTMKTTFICGNSSGKLRRKVLEDFKNGEMKILVSTLLGEGVDIPRMYALILASGGLSSVFVQQIFGRLLRLSEHDIVQFWDISDQCKYLHDHWLERVRFYKSEPAFVLEENIKKINVK